MVSFFFFELLYPNSKNFRRVIESVKAGRRLPEARFSNLSIAGAGQGSVYGLFKATKKKDDTPGSGKTDKKDLKRMRA